MLRILQGLISSVSICKKLLHFERSTVIRQILWPEKDMFCNLLPRIDMGWVKPHCKNNPDYFILPVNVIVSTDIFFVNDTERYTANATVT